VRPGFHRFCYRGHVTNLPGVPCAHPTRWSLLAVASATIALVPLFAQLAAIVTAFASIANAPIPPDTYFSCRAFAYYSGVVLTPLAFGMGLAGIFQKAQLRGKWLGAVAVTLSVCLALVLLVEVVLGNAMKGLNGSL